MFLKKYRIFAALALCLILSCTGCSKDLILDGYNNLLHFTSQFALTPKKNLQGEKTEGSDTYTGSYTANYENFSGTEYLFGGTGLIREKGNELTVTYKLTADSGSVRLYQTRGTDEQLIADTSDSDTYILSLTSQDNYIAIECDDFCGSLQISIK